MGLVERLAPARRSSRASAGRRASPRSRPPAGDAHQDALHRAPRAPCRRACAAPPRSAGPRSGTCRGEQSSRMRRLISAVELVVELRRPRAGPRTAASTARRRASPCGMSTTSASSTSSTAPRRAVDLAGPHPHALAVDGRVRAPVDDGAAARGDADPVAVAPDARDTSRSSSRAGARRPRRPTGTAASRASAR